MNKQPESTHTLEKIRREKLQRIKELGHDPWGGPLENHLDIGAVRRLGREVHFRTQSGEQRPLPIAPPSAESAGREPSSRVDKPVDFRQWLADQGPGELVGPTVQTAGRIVLMRDKGKLKFVDIRDQTGEIQLFIGRKQVGEENWALAECLDLGDIVAAEGQVRYTKTGELTLFVERLRVMSKSLEPPPEKHHGLSDPELRQRMRYLDLAYNRDAMERFLQRSRIVQSIRQTMAQQGFTEVEGPTLHTIAGGAAARPFVTHHNALDMDLFLRIALELHLKRLLVGGINRVYEMGRVYRNEGISPRHNPEFTMLEAYQAYGDYRTMMDLTEKIVADAMAELGIGPQVTWGEQTIDFTPPFQRASYHDLFQKHTGVDPTDQAAVARYAESLGMETGSRHPDVIKNEVFEQKVEDALTGPLFVVDYPASICPLTRRKPGSPELAERFELFIQGMEIANAYSELNDPDLQEELFRTQLAGLSEEESMARMDHDFIRALRHAMPPAGGLGIGIDRLVMLLTNSQTIRDVILFPLLRPES